MAACQTVVIASLSVYLGYKTACLFLPFVKVRYSVLALTEPSGLHCRKWFSWLLPIPYLLFTTMHDFPSHSDGFEVQASKITVPHFHEHNAEELRSRAAVLRRLELRMATREQAEAAGTAVPEPSSSEEDTDDETFTRLHGVMQEQERAMYAGWTGVTWSKQPEALKNCFVSKTDPLEPHWSSLKEAAYWCHAA